MLSMYGFWLLLLATIGLVSTVRRDIDKDLEEMTPVGSQNPRHDWPPPMNFFPRTRRDASEVSIQPKKVRLGKNRRFEEKFFSYQRPLSHFGAPVWPKYVWGTIVYRRH